MVTLETARLRLRPWRVEEAVLQRDLWLERDPRVPPHRRIDADGRPSVADFEGWIADGQGVPPGLLAPERDAEVLGYCGLVDSGRGGPELAFELFRRAWGQGCATEASRAVLDWAKAHGHIRVWATVWDWNTASQRVLAKVGFTEFDREETGFGTNLVLSRDL